MTLIKESIFIDANNGILIFDEIVNVEWTAIYECLEDARLKNKRFPDQWNKDVLPELIEKVKKILLRTKGLMPKPMSTLATYTKEFRL